MYEKYKRYVLLPYFFQTKSKSKNERIDICLYQKRANYRKYGILA